MPEILNSLPISHLEAILHIIDELGFHLGKRTTFFYSGLHFYFNVFYRTRSFQCFSCFLFFEGFLTFWSWCWWFWVFPILVWFLCIFGWSISCRFLYWSFSSVSSSSKWVIPLATQTVVRDKETPMHNNISQAYYKC